MITMQLIVIMKQKQFSKPYNILLEFYLDIRLHTKRNLQT